MNQGIEKGYLSLGICDYGECLHAACCVYWVPSLAFLVDIKAAQKLS